MANPLKAVRTEAKAVSLHHYWPNERISKSALTVGPGIKELEAAISHLTLDTVPMGLFSFFLDQINSVTELQKD